MRFVNNHQKFKQKNMKNNIYIISGPSGSGQDSVVEGLKKYFLIERVVTTTTRAPRFDESQGHPYYFISTEEFKNKIKENVFIEYAQEYNNNFYGVTNTELKRVINSERIGIWRIEYKGVITAKKLYPEIIAILLTAPLEILEDRIRKRDNPDEKILAERMAYTREWLQNHRDIYDYEVVNEQGKLAETIEKIANIIIKHKNSENN